MNHLDEGTMDDTFARQRDCPTDFHEAVELCDCMDECPWEYHHDMSECDCCPEGKHTDIFDIKCTCELGDYQLQLLKDRDLDDNPATFDFSTDGRAQMLDDDLPASTLFPPKPGDHDFIGPLTMAQLVAKVIEENKRNQPAHQSHAPQEVITGEGWGIYCGTRDYCMHRLNEFDVVLNLTQHSIKEEHTIPIPELAKYSNGGYTCTEIVLDWPDMGVVSFGLDWWLDLLAYVQTNKLKMLVFCVGGHGRTGTAIASMLIAGFNYSAKDATDWVRKNYCHRAIESKRQDDYLWDLQVERDARNTSE